MKDTQKPRRLLEYLMERTSNMKRYTIIFIALYFCILPTTWTQAQSETGNNDKNNAPTITVTMLEITDKTLKLSYEIKNNSKDDAWIIVGLDESYRFNMSAHVFLAKDGQTLIITESRDKWKLNEVPSPHGPPYDGRYVRLRPGESQTESIYLKIPVHPSFYPRDEKLRKQGLKYASKLAIEFGYYQGNLPEKIFRTLKPMESILPKDPLDYPTFKDIFSLQNEFLTSRDEELLIPEIFTDFEEKEQILRTVIDNLSIPYELKSYSPKSPKLPDLTSCTKVEFQYHPSALEYFFPYQSLQNLLSHDEKKLLSEKNFVVVEDTLGLKTFVNDFNKIRYVRSFHGEVLVRYRSHVNVVCHYNNKPPASFPVYHNDTIITEGERLVYLQNGVFQCFKALTPLVQAIDLRMKCAANLKNYWYRLRFYNGLEAMLLNNPSLKDKTIYPVSSEWSDAILREYPVLGGLIISTGRLSNKPHIFPSADEIKNRYAMNPNCKPDSAGDMVLLFETKAGWNQHGGPELFSFDNHEPKGGCVLLNDGTVKFIRTKEELNQLRWK